MTSRPRPEEFELVSPSSSRRIDHPILPSQSWYRRLVVRITSLMPVHSAEYSALSENADDFNETTPQRYKPISCTKTGVRRAILAAFVALPISLAVLIFFISVMDPSYTRPPNHYQILRERASQSKDLGRANINGEKIFIASSIWDKQGHLAGGSWGHAILELVDILGPDSVFLSIYQDDPDTKAKKALEEFSVKVKCKLTQDYGSMVWKEGTQTDVKYKLPDGAERLKRTAFMAHNRNRALAPLDDVESPAHAVRFDKLLFIDDIKFDAIDAVNLLFSTNTDNTGTAQYSAVCATSYANPFVYSDTFATRDFEGYGMGVPIFPWFSIAGRAESRQDVSAQKDAVRVRSCWGGMVAFDARLFQPDKATISTQSSLNALHASLYPASASKHHAETDDKSVSGLKFRASTDTFWDAAETCLLHADIEALTSNHHSTKNNSARTEANPEPRSKSNPETETGTRGIYMNPYIRVSSHSSITTPLRHMIQRFETLFSPIQNLFSKAAELPKKNPRRLQREGEEYVDRVWWFEDNDGNDGGSKGRWKNIRRVTLPGGFCGARELRVQGEGKQFRESWFENVPKDHGE